MDVSVYEKNQDGSLKELHRASGGPWGGTCVDRNYIDWMTLLFGIQAIERIKRKSMCDYVDMLREFEKKKRSLTSEGKGRITLRYPPKLKKYHEESDEENIASKIARMNLKHYNYQLRVSVDIARKWFQHPIDMTIRHINGILTLPGMKEVNTILLVGGFAECELVQAAVKKAFEGRTVIVPDKAGLAVLKGAVMFGHQPRLGLISTLNVYNAPSDQVGGKINVHNASSYQVGGKIKECAQPEVQACPDDSSTIELNVPDTISTVIINRKGKRFSFSLK